MTLNELITYIDEGREIEFCLEKTEFFLAPVYSGEIFTGKYCIYNNTSRECAITGDITEIISFEFEGEVSFKNNMDKFEFKFIL